MRTMTDLPLSVTTDHTAPAVGARRRARWRDWALNLMAAGVGLGVALGLGELAVRWLAPQELIVKRPDIWRAVDTLGWVHWPELNTTINTGDRTVRLITDRDGFRVGAAGRGEGKKRVLLLGDSFMEAGEGELEPGRAGPLGK